MPWHQKQWDRVVGMLRSNQFPHALLLLGSAGVGKSLFARCLARMLLCSQDAAPGPCERCASCRLSAVGNHPDFIDIGLLEGKTALAIDQIRSLIQEVMLTARFSGYKVVLIDPVGALSFAAAHTILKTLEEPPGATVFILVANIGKPLLPTIRSRCQRLDFPLPPRQQALAWLVDAVAGNVALAETLLDLAAGAPRLALALNSDQNRKVYADLNADLLAMASAQSRTSSPIAAKWHAVGAAQVVPWLHRVATNLAKLPYTQVTECREIVTALSQRMRRIDPQALIDLYDRTAEAQFALLSQSRLNEQLLLEDLADVWFETLMPPAQQGRSFGQ